MQIVAHMTLMLYTKETLHGTAQPQVIGKTHLTSMSLQSISYVQGNHTKARVIDKAYQILRTFTFKGKQ